MPLDANLDLIESYELDTYQDSYGTLILIGDGASPEVFHGIAGLGDISGPESSVNVVERLTHSTGSRYKGKSPGMIDAGEISVPVNYAFDNPSHADDTDYGLGYLFKTSTRRNMKIVSAKREDGSRVSRQFLGWVSQFSESHPVEGHSVRETTIQIDGEMEDAEVLEAA
jgi:hypothetical protein